MSTFYQNDFFQTQVFDIINKIKKKRKLCSTIKTIIKGLNAGVQKDKISPFLLFAF